MKIAGKILKLFVLLIIIVSAALITASYFLRDKVAEIILGSINKEITTNIGIGSFRLSLLKQFPRASLELKDAYILSSPGFDQVSFGTVNTDTLLVAENVSVDFRLTDIIRQEYDIERIAIKNGRVCLFTDTSGKVNYRIGNEQAGSDSSNLAVNLKRILLSDLKISYNNLAKKLMMDGEIKDGRLTSRILRDYINLGADADLMISVIQLDNFRISGPVNAGLELRMEDSEKGILFKKGNLSVEGFRFLVSGTVSPDNVLDLDLEGENINLSKIRKYIPQEYLKHLAGYDLSGDLQLSSHLTGRLSGTSNPHIELSFNLEKGGIQYSETGMNIKNISFTGLYSNGSGNNQGSAIVTIKDFKAIVGSADYSANLTIRNFLRPNTKLDFKGRIFPGELKQYFRLNNISPASGYCDLELKLNTDVWPKDSITVNDLIKMKPDASLMFNSLNIGLENSKQEVNDINGEMLISGSLKTRMLKFVYRDQKIEVSGEFINLPEWIAGYPVRMQADADIHFDKLIPATFSGKSNNPGEAIVKKKAFTMPEDLLLDIRLKIDSLKHSILPSSSVSADLVYKPGLLTFSNLNMNSLEGTISGNGYIAQNSNLSLTGKGIFNIANVNINKTFTSFRNFGQEFLKAENLSGSLTGSLTLLLPLDSMLKPQAKSMVAEGSYIISDGALVDFEPVKELSSFIELSELENIRFDKLENDFFIRNNSLYIPQMEVNSSAADLSVNGKHSFDNSFEYHVNIRLSELLSKKRKKTKSNNTEFGVVEDDGLGRTSIPLRIESKGDDIKVGYDVKAAGDRVKTSIKSERQSLKTILNQEYGLYKNDTLPERLPAEKKPRFRIQWDESDTVNIDKEPEAGSTKKENTLKGLFRKK
jgi:molybdopterin-binding protein